VLIIGDFDGDEVAGDTDGIDVVGTLFRDEDGDKVSGDGCDIVPGKDGLLLTKTCCWIGLGAGCEGFDATDVNPLSLATMLTSRVGLVVGVGGPMLGMGTSKPGPLVCFATNQSTYS